MSEEPTPPSGRAAGARGTTPPRRRLVPWLFAAFLLLVSLATLELGSRIYWRAQHGYFPLTVGDLYFAYYPELRRALRDPPSRGERSVLLLGGSVLHYAAAGLERGLETELGADTRVHHLAMPAQSSRDSYLKYRILAERGFPRFDAVVYYHGINEVRANNVPPSQFRTNYDHYSWYRQVNAIARFERVPFLTSPVLLHLALQAAAVRLGWLEHLPADRPPPERLVHGRHVRSAEAFRRNLEATLEIAERRGDPFLLLSFAHYLPEDYTRERFLEGRLDYAKTFTKGFDAEIWGLPENVLAGLEAHNRVIRSFADRVRFLDVAEAIPDRGDYFIDICHFSEKGKNHFVRLVVEAVAELTGRRSDPPRAERRRGAAPRSWARAGRAGGRARSGGAIPGRGE